MSVSLYADDVVIFCHPDGTEWRAVRSILGLFGHASGLHTNFAKCSVSPISCSEEVAAEAAVVMECQLAVKYIGIPLSIRRLPGEAFQPVVDQIADKLPKWKAAMMPRAGCLTLIRAVLAAIPFHQLMVLSVNKKALKQVVKILRNFLWVGRKEANGGHGHVNWSRVSRPLFYGGLGIPDLARTATSLRVRWLWRSGGCTQTPCDLGAGSIYNSPRMSGRYSTHPPTWCWVMGPPHFCGRTDGSTGS
jgi:hypothetical protein